MKQNIWGFSLMAIISVSIGILLLPFQMPILVHIYTAVVPILTYTIILLFERFQKKRYYHNLEEKMKGLEEKYLISEIIQTPDFWEGKILKETLQDVRKINAGKCKSI